MTVEEKETKKEMSSKEINKKCMTSYRIHDQLTGGLRLRFAGVLHARRNGRNDAGNDRRRPRQRDARQTRSSAARQGTRSLGIGVRREQHGRRTQ